MTKKFKPIVIGMGDAGLKSLAIAALKMSHTYGLPLVLQQPIEKEFFNPEKESIIDIMSKPIRRIGNYKKSLEDLKEEKESYDPAAHTQAYQGDCNPQAAKAKKKRRKANKAARKARRRNRK